MRDYPTIQWKVQGLENEKLYDLLVNKLDSTGRYVTCDFVKTHLRQKRERVYHSGESTVRLFEDINSSLNQYSITVGIDIYSSQERPAKKLLGKILK